MTSKEPEEEMAPFDPVAYAEKWYEEHPESFRCLTQAIERYGDIRE